MSSSRPLPATRASGATASNQHGRLRTWPRACTRNKPAGRPISQTEAKPGERMSNQPPGYPQDPQPPWQPPQQQPGGPQQFQYPWQQQPPPTGGPQQFQQGWQQQPQRGYPGGAPRPSRKRSKGLRIGCFSVLGLFALFIIIGVIASVASSGNGVKKDSSSGSSDVAASQSPAASSQTPAPPGNNLSGPVGTTFTVTETNDSDATVKYSVT